MPRGVPKLGTNPGWFKAGDPKLKVKSESHRLAIAEGQRRAWNDGRKHGNGPRPRLPIGSTWTDASGYVRVKIVTGDGKWKLEHVDVMERALGRLLNRGEIVHHVNGVKADNRLENLYLCRSHEHHADIERNLLTVVRALIADGIVRFNPASGTYER